MRKMQNPSGMRDLLDQDVLKKRRLQRELQGLFDKYSYEEIMTPAFEYADTYHQTLSGLEDSEMYEIPDANGDLLALRVDMTVPIARAAARKYKDLERPLRLQYASNVYKVKASFAGKRSEVMDCGIERIGGGTGADLEVLAIALEVLDRLPLDSVLEIGSARVFEAALAGVPAAAELADLIDRKEMPALADRLAGLDLPQAQKDFLYSLPLFSGDEAVLQAARAMAFSPALEEAIRELQLLNEQLLALTDAKRLRYDLGKMPHLNYYTGVIFEAYTAGVGTAVLSGGRYDGLLSAFGLQAPAIGFSVKLDYLLEALPDVEKEPAETIVYTPDTLIDALQSAREAEGPVLLVSMEENV